MDFFNSLPLDLKILLIGVAGCALLALFSGNRKTEKRYMLAVTVLAVVGVYRFTHIAAEDEAEVSATENSAPRVVAASPKHIPLVSTSAR